MYTYEVIGVVFTDRNIDSIINALSIGKSEDMVIDLYTDDDGSFMILGSKYEIDFEVKNGKMVSCECTDVYGTQKFTDAGLKKIKINCGVEKPSSYDD